LRWILAVAFFTDTEMISGVFSLQPVLNEK